MHELKTRTAPASWAADLEQSAAEIAAGLTMPVAPLLEELRISAKRLEARLRASGTMTGVGAAPQV